MRLKIIILVCFQMFFYLNSAVQDTASLHVVTTTRNDTRMLLGRTARKKALLVIEQGQRDGNPPTNNTESCRHPDSVQFKILQYFLNN